MTRGMWRHDAIGWAVAMALLPLAATVLAVGGWASALVLAAALAGAAFWQVAFRALRGVPLSPSGLVTALAVATLGPLDLALWQVALGAGFGIVVGEMVFGGWGRNVIGAPAVAVAFLYLAYPAAPPPLPVEALGLAAGVSGLLLLLFGVLSPVLVAGAALAASATLTALGGAADATSASALALALVLIVGDPVAAPTERAARLAYGALAGALAALLSGADAGLSSRALVFSGLLAQVFAPLLDHAAITLTLARRRRRHG